MKNRKLKLIVLIVFALFVPFAAFSVEYNILNFGAVGDGITLNTKSIQEAIDKANQNGGGRVIVPAGEFLSGSLIIKSGVELYLEKEAVILGSTNPFDYLSGNNLLHFINAEKAVNIGITGLGTIDGRGRLLALTIDSLFFAGKWDDPGYNYRRHRPERRPKLLHFSECRNVVLEGFTARRSASWVLDFDRCVNMTIHKVTVDR